ncbi:MAG: hypothetical protein QGI45_14365 [Myxococcota bacterium]|jgi:hypothetical protein|nr:hypothetical protein [Myxococcota bacterium]
MWKIRRDKSSVQAYSSIVVLEHEWREDFVGEALSIFIDGDHCLARMDFYSAKYGCTRWLAASGIHLPQLWCDNNTAEGEPVSYFREHLFSRQGVHSGNRLIVEVILRQIPYGHLQKAIRRALLNPRGKVVLPEVFFGGLIGAAA